MNIIRISLVIIMSVAGLTAYAMDGLPAVSATEFRNDAPENEAACFQDQYFSSKASAQIILVRLSANDWLDLQEDLDMYGTAHRIYEGTEILIERQEEDSMIISSYKKYTLVFTTNRSY